jgi:hypothetical protein
MRKRRIGYCVICGALVSLAVLVLLIQVLGVPFWWAFGVGNTQDGWWILTVTPENPRIGENVTVQVWAGNIGLLPMRNATVTVTHNGMLPLTILTNESADASFEYPGDGTVVRASMHTDHSLYVAIPHTPPSWVRILSLSVCAAIASGLLVGAGTFVCQRRLTKQR